jgi:glycosyltransferase involved in cell wall biosynthesis
MHLNIVVPCFDEEEVLPETADRLIEMLDQLKRDGAIEQGSIVFVDDGSRDGTWGLIEDAHARDARVCGLKLSRNRGHQNALLAGLLTARGDVVISLDADLQDDLDAIPKMIDAHRDGADIVLGVRARRDADPVFKRLTARAYYVLLRRFGIEAVPEHADFRLMSRRALDALSDFREVNLYLRGVIPLLGFRTARVFYERRSRFAGESKYPLGKMVALAMNGIVSFSTVPLQWISIVGFLVAAMSMLVGVWALSVRLFTHTALPGWASTVVPMYFLGGLQMLALGIIGEYTARIYSETKQRPRFIIEQSI